MVEMVEMCRMAEERPLQGFQVNSELILIITRAKNSWRSALKKKKRSGKEENNQPPIHILIIFAVFWNILLLPDDEP